MMNHLSPHIMTGLPFNLEEVDLDFDPDILASAPDANHFDLLTELVGPDYVKRDPNADQTTLDAALAIFLRAACDNAYDGLTRTDLFGAALYQAMVIQGLRPQPTHSPFEEDDTNAQG